jgi:hypothetical protein
VVPRDYAYWDKFDIDKELLKMELEDERRKEQAMKKRKQQEKETKTRKIDEEDQFASAAGLFIEAISSVFVSKQSSLESVLTL